MIVRMGNQKILQLCLLATSMLLPLPGWSQAPAPGPATRPPAAPRESPAPQVIIDQPDANRTREELSRLLQRYPPTVRNVFAVDSSLLANQAYLAPYPALANFLSAHPEILRDPVFYVGEDRSRFRQDNNTTPGERVWGRMVENITIFAGFGMAFGVLAWLVRMLLDYRRWNRLTKIQTDVHTKILDRFSGNEDLLAYIKSPAGSKFLESTPIALDAGPRSVGAPLGRILWSVQAGLVLVAGGIGLQVVSSRVTDEAAQPIHALGILGISLGLGFVISALISFLISQRLGLIESVSPAPRVEPPPTLG